MRESKENFIFEGREFRMIRINCGLPVQRVETYIHDALCVWYEVDAERGANFFQTKEARDEAIKHQYYVTEVEKIEFEWLFWVKWKWALPDYL